MATSTTTGLTGRISAILCHKRLNPSNLKVLGQLHFCNLYGEFLFALNCKVPCLVRPSVVWISSKSDERLRVALSTRDQKNRSCTVAEARNLNTKRRPRITIAFVIHLFRESIPLQSDPLLHGPLTQSVLAFSFQSLLSCSRCDDLFNIPRHSTFPSTTTASEDVMA